MKALLLAAGFGKRLKPLTQTIPKCLVPIQGKPLLEIWLENLNKVGVEQFLINTHYFAEQVEKYIKQSPFQKQTQLVHETNLLGTGGTLLANQDFFEGQSGLLIHADNYCLCNFQDFIQAHQNRPKHAVFTMMTFATTTPKTCGVVELDHQNIVQNFHEKVQNPPSNLANGAVYIFEHEVIEFLQSLNKQIIDFSTEVIPHFLGKIYAWHNTNIHIDIGTPQTYQLAQTIHSQKQSIN